MTVSLRLDSIPVSLQSFQQQLFAELDQQLAGKSQVYVALSGGMDSVVLAHLLACWHVARTSQSSSYPDISAIHVHHGLMAEADDWLLFCQQLAEQLQLGFVAERVEVTNQGDGIEQAARQARYRVFEKHCLPGSVLLMGHHADDQLETLLGRMSRGSGLNGLVMPGQRWLSATADVQIWRPLLKQPRSLLQRWAEQFQLNWVEDPSNSDTSYERNWWRQQCLPAIEQRFPGRKQSMLGTIEVLQEESAALSLLLQPVMQQCLIGSRYPNTADDALALEPVLQQPEALRALILKQWLLANGCSVKSREWLQQLLEQSRSAADSNMQLAAGKWTIRRHQGALYLVRSSVDESGPSKHPAAPVEWSIGLSSVPVAFAWQGGRLMTASALGDGGRHSGVHSSGIAAGDYLISSQSLAGFSNKTALKPVGRPSKSLKHIWQQYQVPVWLRADWPLLLQTTPAGNRLVGVVGLVFDHSIVTSDADSVTPLWEKCH